MKFQLRVTKLYTSWKPNDKKTQTCLKGQA